MADLLRVADPLKAVDLCKLEDLLWEVDPLKDLADHHPWHLLAHQASLPDEPEDRDNLCTFLNKLFLFFEARPADYVTDQSRIVTALTFMDGPKVITWKTFQPIEEAATAASKLYHLGYRPAALDTFNAQFFHLCPLVGILEDTAQLSFYKEHLPESMRQCVHLTYPVPTTINNSTESFHNFFWVY
ncbi:hypothetical protein DICSQDRAFT_175630 [Dichomitus squalens LYAD-421 SS1]|uniref:Uncharacterized protein n=1 Tax=Dichomitus squalens (strain LYAD-421) TaxID=732165 RepID=R7SIM3_DICSQ|nr:uncharacterized protein DICSQDRAFT_175630 [Dichomitus squalens LYAD-421 SS1]EJF55683.1 hypothetical protein DICSQDRAFT_175630 [Dichomitus squalens LYAD-421 SS1]